MRDHTLPKLGHFHFFLKEVWTIAPSLRQAMLRLHVPPKRSSLLVLLWVIITGKNHERTLSLPPPPGSGDGATNRFTRLVSLQKQLQKAASRAFPPDSCSGAEQPDPYEQKAQKLRKLPFFSVLKVGIFWLHYFRRSDSTEASACARRHQAEMELLLTGSWPPGNDKRFISPHQGVL